MSITQVKIARNERAAELKSIKDYCKSAEMILTSDNVRGFWLHCDGSIRYIRHIGEIRGWVDYLDAPQG